MLLVAPPRMQNRCECLRLCDGSRTIPKHCSNTTPTPWATAVANVAVDQASPDIEYEYTAVVADDRNKIKLSLFSITNLAVVEGVTPQVVTVNTPVAPEV